MGCAQDLLGVSAAPVVFEAARKSVGVVFQRTGFGANLALALLALAFPVHDGGLFARDVAAVSVWVRGVTNLAALVPSFRYSLSKDRAPWMSNQTAMPALTAAKQPKSVAELFKGILYFIFLIFPSTSFAPLA